MSEKFDKENKFFDEPHTPNDLETQANTKNQMCF